MESEMENIMYSLEDCLYSIEEAKGKLKEQLDGVRELASNSKFDSLQKECQALEDEFKKL